MSSRLTSQWFPNVRADLLAGLVVALALIPESIAFSVIANVDPQVCLFASVVIAVTIAFVGGRSAMISASTGAIALLVGDLVKDHGLAYLLAASMLTGIIQIVLGLVNVANVMRFVSASVMTGFVNALAILYMITQANELILAGNMGSWVTFPLVAGGLAIIYLFPLITKAVPSPLIAIVVISLIANFFEMDVRRVKDLGILPTGLPYLDFENWKLLPLTWETLLIILPVSLSFSVVGLLESLMTAQILDEFTDTPSDKNKEARGQGIANIASSLFGGIAGCAMIGQSVINVKSGGRGRLSTLTSGVVLLVLLLVMNTQVGNIPMAALVAVMIMVSIGTFNWATFKNLKIQPKMTSIVMLATVGTVVGTHNLAIGVGVGVLLSGIFFAHKVSQVIGITSELSGDTRTYTVRGQIFFASADTFGAAFDFKEVLSKIVIDVSQAHFWDLTSVGALDKVVLKYRREGAEVEILGMNEASATIVGRLGTHDKPGALERMLDH
ncbi:SulP family inorganic anion transporter [Luteolibacter sp. AS25]|uniref:SulP family inorganic anion transporter n=1 Tax=Luteolibacter sp. AS25 TaxID=3135776 RepID=UPI00398B7B3C